MQCEDPNVFLRVAKRTRTQQAARLSGALGVQVIRHGTKKPEGGDAIARQLHCDLARAAFVGDRLLTDVVFGNINKMLTIHTQPLTTARDNKLAAKVCAASDVHCLLYGAVAQQLAVLQIRQFENGVIKPYMLRGVAPLPHVLYQADAGVVRQGGHQS